MRISITTQEAKYLVNALTKDSCRPVLQQACLQCVDGEAILATTDTHRLHMIHCGASEAFAPVLIDLKRLLFEARYYKHGLILIDSDAKSAYTMDRPIFWDPVMKENDLEKLWDLPKIQVDTPVFDRSDKQFPNFAKVIPPQTPLTVLAAFNWKYIVNACELADCNRVVMFGEGETRPVLFQEPTDFHRWRSVVMTMDKRQWTPSEEATP